ncbi:unnamed protein product [Nippostrongylus brasiliensis]|uniref:Peptide transporter 3 n=1 Tax=Nippostrongylus brasiliensis TaxID=27835 RepID=A0A0N4YUL6_NIPBR|nr:unnamed protein product [Nippostrongylus brasiliensis]
MQTFFIFGNEFCERFSYYGMRSMMTYDMFEAYGYRQTVLTLYFMTILRFDGDQATVWYHLFVFVCYCSPIAGSIIADGYIGKYQFLDLLSIMLVGLGTGGIKPCVPAFGADQFPQEEKEMISMFFSVFYVAINCGSLISTFITPILRVQSCFGAETCFSLAFGVPAVLMILATVLFVVGTPCYVRNPPKENIIALEKLVEDIKGVIRVLVLMLPIPVFFALYDQQGSRWILQAVSMDGRITSGFTLYPDQMNVFNPLLVIILVPIFQTIIYPKLERMGWNPTLLQRMGLGGYVAAVSFVVCGIVQLYVDSLMDDKAKGVIRTFRIGEHLSDNKVFIILSKDPQCPSDSKISERLEAGKNYLLVLTPAGWTFFSHEHKKDNKALGQFSLR